VTGIVDGLRRASWLTPERVRAHARTVAIVGWLVLAALLATSHGGVDLLGRPIGTDFSSFYAAGTLARAGQPAGAYDWPLLRSVEQSIFGAGTPFYSWAYPPFALMPMALLAGLPYLLALAVFVGLTFVAFWVVVRRMVPPGPEALWAFVGFPAIFVNAAHGQNGFLSTALLGAGLMLLERRPVAAGVAFGLLAFKPQLALLVPVALAFERRWSTIAAAAATVAVLLGAALLAYGPSPWSGFFQAAALSRQAILEQGGTGFHKLQSVLAAVRLLGGPSTLAWVLQAAASIAALAVVAWLWRGRATPAVKGAALVAGGLLATPFLNVYDLVLLALPLALLAPRANGPAPLPWERLVLLAAWLLPFVAVAAAGGAMLPLTPLVLVALLWLCWRRTAR